MVLAPSGASRQRQPTFVPLAADGRRRVRGALREPSLRDAGSPILLLVNTR